MSIPNLINIEPNENCIIVNMEDKTTASTVWEICEGSIFYVKLYVGMKYLRLM